MSLEMGLIDRHVFKRLDPHTFFNLQHTINQQDRIAVRQLLEDLVDVHHVQISLLF